MDVAVPKLLSGSNFRRNVAEQLGKNSDVSLNLPEGDHVLNPDYQNSLVEKAVKAAAVLIPVIERSGGLSVIFTKRTEKLKSHSGQVSFPGGKIDASDESARYAALRETHEEIGVEADLVDVLGQLPDYHTGSGYLISPVVGLVDTNAAFNANRDEVEYIFEVPLDFLMDPDNHIIGSIMFENIERYYYEMLWDDQRIWGVTAGIVRLFYNRIYK
ncbi:MAG: CoA pyrophosphatase [Hyphomicrobiales bacterium]|nr:CoA pyrophosphatase [Hyphomicrobiales bacterium]